MFKKLLERLAQTIAHYLYPHKIREGEEQIFCYSCDVSNTLISGIKENLAFNEHIKLDMVRKLAEVIYKQGFINIEERRDEYSDSKIYTIRLICKKY